MPFTPPSPCTRVLRQVLRWSTQVQAADRVVHALRLLFDTFEAQRTYGQARGVVLMTPALLGLVVGEYAANLVKKSIVGAGHADKTQVQMMVKILLPTASFKGADAADALAIAICHAHHRSAPGLRAAG